MNYILKCPICHSTLIHITPIILENPLDIIGYEGYCPSMRCTCKKITFDKDYNVIGIKRFRDINTKRRVVARILEQNWDKYSYKTKKKLWQKYERAKKYL